jgi:hypothetical protein
VCFLLILLRVCSMLALMCYIYSRVWKTACVVRCTHTHTITHTHTHKHTHIPTITQTHTHKHTHPQTHTHTRVCVYRGFLHAEFGHVDLAGSGVQLTCVCVCECVCVCVCVCLCVCVCVCLCVHTVDTGAIDATRGQQPV